VEILLRRAPQTTVVVCIVSSVLAPEWLRHPLIRLRKGRRERQLLAELLQVIQNMIFGRRSSITPRVSFGKPATVAELRAGDNSDRILPAIIYKAQQLLADHTSNNTP
jgi:hypothetical protein